MQKDSAELQRIQRASASSSNGRTLRVMGSFRVAFARWTRLPWAPGLLIPVVVACVSPTQKGARVATIDGRSVSRSLGTTIVRPILGPGERVAGGSATGTDIVGLSTGFTLTRDAVPGTVRVELNPGLRVAPDFRAGLPASLTRAGAHLAVVTTGFDRASDGAGAYHPETAGNWLFILRGDGDHAVEKAFPIPASLGGISASKDGKRLLVGGGGDDAFYIFDEGAAGFVQTARIDVGLKTIHGLGGLGLGSGPFVGEVALSADGEKAMAVLHGNDALAFFSLPRAAAKVPGAHENSSTLPGAVRRIDLRPGRGVAGGEAPYALAACGHRAFVASLRDDEIVVVDVKEERVLGRVKVGALPVALAVTKDCATLVVAEANADAVSFVDASKLVVTGRLSVGLHPKLRISGPNALAFSPDERELAVSLGGANAVARIDLTNGVAQARVASFMPTGFYPTTLVHEGASLVVGTAKTEGGPNPLGPWSLPEVAVKNPYTLGRGVGFTLQEQEAAIYTHLLGNDKTLVKTLTDIVRDNARLDVLGEEEPAIYTELRKQVSHVIYVIGENRTFDQLFADLDGVDGDRNLLLWGRGLSPNQHALADAVALDHFFVTGDVSGQGWPWSTSARTSEWLERVIPAEYAQRGKYAYAWEGGNRGINVGLATVAERKLWNAATPDDEDLLPGAKDFGAVESAEGGGAGFLWDEALRKGLSVRNYGFFCDDSRTHLPATDPNYLSPELREPWKTSTRVAFPTRASLVNRTDPYFRCYDQKFPDVYRIHAWEREFEGFVERGDLPSLSLVRLSHDHFGHFDKAIDGVDTPDTQMADHDYAIGRLVERVAESKYWENTVIIVTEDDAQNGSDHVHSHRSFVLFAGGRVASGVRSETRYTTPSVLRTIELLLGLGPLAVADAVSPPIVEAFDPSRVAPGFRAIVPAILRGTKLRLPPRGGSEAPGKTLARGTAEVWAKRTVGFEFDEPDRVPSWAFERLLAGHLGARAHTPR